MELVRQKNVSTYIFFPLVDAAGAIVTGSANPDSESDTFADGTAPNGFADLTNEATEIGTDGWYYILLTQAEMNFDYIAIQVKSDDALTQHILIRTIAGDPALLATTAATDAIKTDTAAILIDTDTMEADLKTYLDAIETNLEIDIEANDTLIDTAITDIAAVKADTAAILIDTDTMEADLTTEIDANETKIDTLQTDVTAIKAITDAIPNAGALTDLKGDTAAILIDTDTLEADLKTYLDAIETNLEGDIEANDTLIDTAITDIAAVKADTAAILIDTDTMEADIKTELTEIKCLSKHNLAVEFTWDGSSDNEQTDFYGYDTAANATTNDHATGKLIHVKGTTASFTDHKPAKTIFIDADE